MKSATSEPFVDRGTPDAPPLLTRLRAATADAHRRVEDRLFPSALVDVDSYRSMLQVLLALHEPLEQRFRSVAGFDRLDLDLERRRKSPRLRADLAALVTPARPAAARPAPGSPGGPRPAWEPTDLPSALGAFYVLEGSTLGGRVLLEQVRAGLGPVPTEFLAGYGDDTGRYWHRTRRALVAGVAADADPSGAADRLIAGATATFDRLDGLLDADGWPVPGGERARA